MLVLQLQQHYPVEQHPEHQSTYLAVLMALAGECSSMLMACTMTKLQCRTEQQKLSGSIPC